MENLIQFFTDRRVRLTVLVIVASSILYWAINFIVDATIRKVTNSTRKDKRKHQTYLKLFDNFLIYAFLIVDLILILQIFGVNVSSLVAGLGIISVITGLALQDAFKDIIAGFNIIIDGYFNVGDVIKIDDVEGKILEIRMKVTKLKDINNENFYTVANKNIVKALKISEQLDIDIPIPYEEDTLKIEGLIDQIMQEVKKNKNVKDIVYKGINQFGDSAVYYKIRLWAKPELKPQVKRDTLRIIKITLDENNIRIPYKQIDIHQGK